MLARMPMLFARAKPRFAPASITRTSGPAARGLGAAVGRSVVDDDDLVRGRRRRGVQRLEAALEIGARVEARR